MKLSQLTPDSTLASLLDKQIMVEDKPIRAYANAARPNDNLGNSFLEVLYNGSIQSITEPIGYYRGNLALAIYTLANSDQTANKICMRRILEQVETLVDGVSCDNIFFKLSATPITPITVNSQNGYGMMVLNIEWHTTSEDVAEDYEIKLTIDTDGDNIYPKTSRELKESEGFCPLSCGAHKRRYYLNKNDNTGRLWAAQYRSNQPYIVREGEEPRKERVLFPYRLNKNGALRSIITRLDRSKRLSNDFFDIEAFELHSSMSATHINTYKTACSLNGILAIKGEQNYVLYGVAVYRLVWIGNKLRRAVRISNVVYVKKHIKCLKNITEYRKIERGVDYDSWFTT